MKRAILSMLMCAGMLAAQAGPPPGDAPDGPRRGKRGAGIEALQSALDISPEQAQELAQFAKQQRQEAFEGLKNEGVREKLRANREALRELRESGNADPAAVGALVLEAEALGAKMKAVRDGVRESVVAYVTNTLGRGAELAEIEAAAKMQPAVRAAGALGLLAPSEGRMRRGMGMRRPGGGGPQGVGPGGPPPTN